MTSEAPDEPATQVKTRERDEIVWWLRRRARICYENIRWWRPFRRQWLKTMGAIFNAAAYAIEAGAHVADTVEDETAAFKTAIKANRDSGSR